MKKFGFGIIGTGSIARLHAEAIHHMKEGELIACFSTNKKKGEAFAKDFEIDRYGDLEGLLDDDSIDIVTICTPSGAHLDPALAAARRGKHLIIEKPLEVTGERCDRIIEEAERNRVALATVFQNRYTPAARRLKLAISEGRLGNISLAVARVLWYRKQEYYDESRWRGTWELDGGGALMNQSIHVVDLLQWYMGEVKDVRAFAGCRGHTGIEVEDTAAVLLDFTSGAFGLLAGTTAAYPGSFKSIEIAGSGGTVELEEHLLKKWDFRVPRREDEEIIREYGTISLRKSILSEEEGSTQSGPVQDEGGARDPMNIGYAAHKRQFEEVCAAIEEGRSPEIDGGEGKKSVEIIRRIYRAAGLI